MIKYFETLNGDTNTHTIFHFKEGK